jgi:hypothetical protein
MVKLTRKEAEYIVAAGAAVDFLTEGKYTGKVSRAVKAAVRKGLPVATRAAQRTAPRLAGTAFQVGRTIAMRHPYLTAGAVIYYTVKNRREIANLVGQGYEIVDDVTRPVLTEAASIAESVGAFPSQEMGARSRFGEPILDVLGIEPVKKRKRSSFNSAVSRGMKAVKKSKYLGKPGKFTNPKKAFGTVTKVASRLKKGGKVSTKGVSGVIRRAVGKIK